MSLLRSSTATQNRVLTWECAGKPSGQHCWCYAIDTPHCTMQAESYYSGYQYTSNVMLESPAYFIPTALPWGVPSPDLQS